MSFYMELASELSIVALASYGAISILTELLTVYFRWYYDNSPKFPRAVYYLKKLLFTFVASAMTIIFWLGYLPLANGFYYGSYWVAPMLVHFIHDIPYMFNHLSSFPKNTSNRVLIHHGLTFAVVIAFFVVLRTEVLKLGPVLPYVILWNGANAIVEAECSLYTHILIKSGTKGVHPLFTLWSRIVKIVLHEAWRLSVVAAVIYMFWRDWSVVLFVVGLGLPIHIYDLQEMIKSIHTARKALLKQKQCPLEDGKSKDGEKKEGTTTTPDPLETERTAVTNTGSSSMESDEATKSVN